MGCSCVYVCAPPPSPAPPLEVVIFLTYMHLGFLSHMVARAGSPFLLLSLFLLVILAAMEKEKEVMNADQEKACFFCGYSLLCGNSTLRDVNCTTDNTVLSVPDRTDYT